MSKAITSCKKALAYLLTAAMVLGMAVTSPITAMEVKAAVQSPNIVFGGSASNVIRTAIQKQGDSDVNVGDTSSGGGGNGITAGQPITITVTDTNDYYIESVECSGWVKTWDKSTDEDGITTWTGVIPASKLTDAQSNDITVAVEEAASKTVGNLEDLNAIARAIDPIGLQTDNCWNDGAGGDSVVTDIKVKGGKVTTDGGDSIKTSSAIGLFKPGDKITFELTAIPGYKVEWIEIENNSVSGNKYYCSCDEGVYKSEEITVNGDISIEKIHVAHDGGFNVVTNAASGLSIETDAVKAYHDTDLKFKVKEDSAAKGAVAVQIDNFVDSNIKDGGTLDSKTFENGYAGLGEDDGWYTIPGKAIVGNVNITAAVDAAKVKVTATAPEGYKVKKPTDLNVEYTGTGAYHTAADDLIFGIYNSDDELQDAGKFVVTAWDNGLKKSVTVPAASSNKFTIDNPIPNLTLTVAMNNEHKVVPSMETVADGTEIYMTVDGVADTEITRKSGKEGKVLNKQDLTFKVKTAPGKILKTVGVKIGGNTITATRQEKGSTNSSPVFYDTNSVLTSSQTYSDDDQLALYEYTMTLAAANVNSAETTTIEIICTTDEDTENKFDVQMGKATLNASGEVTQYDNFTSKYNAEVTADSFAGYISKPGLDTVESKHITRPGSGKATLTIEEIKKNYEITDVKIIEKVGDDWTKANVKDVTSSRNLKTPTGGMGAIGDYTADVGSGDMKFVVYVSPIKKTITIDDQTGDSDKVKNITISVQENSEAAVEFTKTSLATKNNCEVSKGSSIKINISGVVTPYNVNPVAYVNGVKNEALIVKGSGVDAAGNGQYTISKLDDSVTIKLVSDTNKFSVIDESSDGYSVKYKTASMTEYAEITSATKLDGTEDVTFKVFKGTNAVTTTDITNAGGSGKVDFAYRIGDATEWTAITANPLPSADKIAAASIKEPVRVKAMNAEKVVKESGSDAGYYITTKSLLDAGKHSDTTKAASVGVTTVTANGNVDAEMPKAVCSKEFSFAVAKAEKMTSAGNETKDSNSWTLCDENLVVTYQIGAGGEKTALEGATKGVYYIPTVDTNGQTAIDITDAVTIKVKKAGKTTFEFSENALSMIDFKAAKYRINATAGAAAGDYTIDLPSEKLYYSQSDVSDGAKSIWLYLPLKAEYADDYIVTAKLDNKTDLAVSTTGVKGITTVGISGYSAEKILDHTVAIDVKDVTHELTIDLTSSNQGVLNTTTLKVTDANGNTISPITKTGGAAGNIYYELKAADTYYIEAVRSKECINDFGALDVKISGVAQSMDGNYDGERWAVKIGNDTTYTIAEAGGLDTSSPRVPNLSVAGTNYEMPIYVGATEGDKYVITGYNYKQNDNDKYGLYETVNGSITVGAGVVATTAKDSEKTAFYTRDVSITPTARTGYIVKDVKAYIYKGAADSTIAAATITEEVNVVKSGNKWTVKGGTYGTKKGSDVTPTGTTALLFVINTEIDPASSYNLNFSMDENIEMITVTNCDATDEGGTGGSGLSPAVNVTDKTYTYTVQNPTAITGTKYVTFTVTPKTGYTVDKLSVNGTPKTWTSGGKYGVAFTADTDKGKTNKTVTVTSKPIAAANDLYFSFKNEDTDGIKKIEVIEDNTLEKLSGDVYKISSGRTADVKFNVTVSKGYKIVNNAFENNNNGIFRTDEERTKNADGTTTYSFKMAPAITNVTDGGKVTVGALDALTKANAKVFTVQDGATAEQKIKIKNVNSAATNALVYTINGGAAISIAQNGTSSDAQSFREGDTIKVTLIAHKDIYDSKGNKLNDNTDRGPAEDGYYTFTAALDDPEDDGKTYEFSHADKARTDAGSFEITGLVNNTTDKDVEVADVINAEPGTKYTISLKGTTPDGNDMQYGTTPVAVSVEPTPNLSTATENNGTNNGVDKVEVTVSESVKVNITSTYTDTVTNVATKTTKSMSFVTEEPARSAKLTYKGAEITNDVVEIEKGSKGEKVTVKAYNKDGTELPLTSVNVVTNNTGNGIVCTYENGVITVDVDAEASGTAQVGIVSKATGLSLINLTIKPADRVLTISDVTVSASKTKLNVSATGEAGEKSGVEAWYEITVTDPVKATTKVYNFKASGYSLASQAIDIDSEVGTKLTVAAKLFEVATGTAVPAEGAYASPLAASDSISKEVTIPARTVKSVSASPSKVTLDFGKEAMKTETVTISASFDVEGEALKASDISYSPNRSEISVNVKDDGVVTFTTSAYGDKTPVEYTFWVDGDEAKKATVAVTNRPESSAPSGAEPGTPEDIPDEYEKPEDSTLDINDSKLVIKASKEYTYTGKPIQAAVKVVANPNKLVNGVDYKVTYADNVEAGKGKILVSGINQYNGLLDDGEIEFTINPKKLGGTVVAGAVGEEPSVDDIEGAISVYDGTKLLSYGDDYEIAESSIVPGKGKYDFDITYKGNYTGTKKASVKMAVGNDLALCDVEIKFGKDFVEDEATYTGKAFTVKNGNMSIEVTDPDGNDVTAYSVSYKNNTNVGVGTVTLKGKKPYAGSKVVRFVINRNENEESIIDAKNIIVNNGKAMTYTGKLLKPSVKVQAMVNGKLKNLSKNKDYVVYYSSELNAGKGYVVIRPIGNYEGQDYVEKEFTINKADFKKVSIKKDKSTKRSGIYFNNKKLVEGEDFEVISSIKNGDKYTVTIQAADGSKNFEKASKTKVIKGKKDQIDWAQLFGKTDQDPEEKTEE